MNYYSLDLKKYHFFKKFYLINYFFHINFFDKLSISWNYISWDETLKLSTNFLIKFQDKINWNLLIKRQKINVNHNDIINIIINTCNIINSIKYQKISEFFVEKIGESGINWRIFSEYQNLWDFSDDFIEKYKKNIVWNVIQSNNKIPHNFIEKYIELFDINKLISSQKLSSKIIKIIRNKVGSLFDNKIQKFQQISPKLSQKIGLESNIIILKNNEKIMKYLLMSNIDEHFATNYYNFIDWNFLSMYDKLLTKFPLKFILKNKTKFNWKEISKHQRFFLENSVINEEIFIKYKFYELVDWINICRFNRLKENFLKKFIQYFSKDVWKIISFSQNFSHSFIDQFQNFLDWETLSIYYDFDEELIDKYKDKIKWNWILSQQRFIQNLQGEQLEQFVDKYSNYIDWICLSNHRFLTNNIIEKYFDKIDWNIISKYGCKNINFIKKWNKNIDFDICTIYCNERILEDLIDNNLPVNWNLISKYQISEKIINKYPDKINWNIINRRLFEYNSFFSPEFICHFMNKIDWFYISIANENSTDFINNYLNHFKLRELLIYNKYIFHLSFLEELIDYFMNYFKHNYTEHQIKHFWKLLSKKQRFFRDGDISDIFIQKYHHLIDWIKWSKYQKMSQNFINKYVKYLDFDMISKYQNLSKNFILKYKHKMKIKRILKYQILDYKFIFEEYLKDLLQF